MQIAVIVHDLIDIFLAPIFVHDDIIDQSLLLLN
jgi:hypothetical protein